MTPRMYRAQHSIKRATFHLKICSTRREAELLRRTHEWAYRDLKTKCISDFATDPDLPLYKREELRTRLRWDRTVEQRLKDLGCVVELPSLSALMSAEALRIREKTAARALLELRDVNRITPTS